MRLQGSVAWRLAREGPDVPQVRILDRYCACFFGRSRAAAAFTGGLGLVIRLSLSLEGEKQHAKGDQANA